MIFLQPYKKYAVFAGRATRKEFWSFNLFYFTGLIVVINIEETLGGGVEGFFILWWFAHVIPQIAVGVRRLHDTNKSGWMTLFMLIPLLNIYLLILFCIDSDKESNRFGENPK
jgi:uncharacterized membrane protein YhaH (DUF805 family)